MRWGAAAITCVVMLGCAPSSPGSAPDAGRPLDASADAADGSDAACGTPPGLVCGPWEGNGLQSAAWCGTYGNPGACYACAGPMNTCGSGWCEWADPCGTPPCWLAPYPCTDAGMPLDASDGSDAPVDATTD